MKKLLLVILLTLGMLDVVFAAGRGITTREHPWLMRSVAALGMGDAYYAKSDSKYAPFYNPAGLARIKDGTVDIIPFAAGVNSGLYSFYKDFRDMDTGDSSAIGKFLADRMGNMYHADLSFYPGYTRKNFTVGFFTAAQVNAAPWNPVMPELNVDATADWGIVTGIAGEFMQERLQVGIAGRYQQRYSIVRSYTVSDIVSGELDDIDFADLYENGWDVIFDLGMMYNVIPDHFLQPRIALAMNNLGIFKLGDAKDLPWSMTLSAGISPSWRFITTDIVLDIRDIAQHFEQDKGWGKRINLGAEIRFYEMLALRLGMHQGWTTYGAGIDLKKILRLNYACYSEEIGAYAGQKKDTRHVFEFVLGF